MQDIIQQINAIIQPAPALTKVPIQWLLPYKKDCPKYSADEQGRLIGLNLGKTGLSDQQWDQICQLPGVPDHLQSLNLCENALTRFHFTPQMSALEEVILSENPQLRDLHFEADLPRMQFLDLSECAIEQLRLPALFERPPVQERPRPKPGLYLQKNQLRELHCTAACPRLECLELSHNQLRRFALPAGWDALKYLYLHDNELEELVAEAPPRQLSMLYLRNNRLKSLPHNLLSFTSLQVLNLHNNAFEGNLASAIPTGEHDNAFKRVYDYLLAMQGGTVKNERVKIIMVGNGRVGKTSLFKRLKGLPYDPNEPLTHGINLGQLDKTHLPDLPMERVQANVWDFGGQEIFYATHQFFLTDDALYILAWTDPRNVEAYRERDKKQMPRQDEKWRDNPYWLENIRHYSLRGPVLMVQTHFDRFHADLKEDFTQAPYAAKCLNFSAVEENGGLLLSKIRAAIADRLQEIPHLGEAYPISYDRVIGALEKIKAKRKIPRAEFDAICQKAEVPDGGETSALEFLNVTGVLVWFGHNETLSQTVFIDPNWIADQAYQLIHPDLETSKGRISREWIHNKLSHLSDAEKEQLITLLMEFKLIFEKNGQYIAPQYLPQALDEDAQKLYAKAKRKLQPAFRFCFSRFLPDNVMVNFLCNYGPFSDEVYYRTGIHFTWAEEGAERECDCIVELNESERVLTVYTGATHLDYRLRAKICRDFVDLSRNANAEVAPHGQPFVSWQALETAYHNNINKIMPTDYATPVEVGVYTGLFENPVQEEVPKEPTAKKPVIYFSYAWGDPEEEGESREQIVNELYESLLRDGFEVRRDKMNLEYGGLISQFMQELGRGDLIVVFVSDKYVRSPYCMNELLEIARNCRFDKSEFKQKVLPVPVERIRFDQPKVINNYFDYWEAEEAEWKKLRDRRQTTVEQDKRYHLVREINHDFGKLTDWLSDMNQSTTALLRAEDFELVKKAILERIGSEI